MVYVSPGRLYLESHGQVSGYEDILAYAEFLRSESGLNGKIPVDLATVFRRFEIPDAEYAPLPQQQGLLMDPDQGLMIINSEDRESRQKFTRAHELVEMLFAVLPSALEIGSGWKLQRPGGFHESTKEYLCNWAAANLLMPPEYVTNLLQQTGVSLTTAKALATACEVSLSAALVQLARHSMDGSFVVLWKMKYKPSELKAASGPGQSSFLEIDVQPSPKKLRVEWSMGGVASPFIPKNKSAERTSLIYRAWETGNFTAGIERMTFDNRTSASCYSENMPFQLLGERCVISLIRKGLR